MRTKSEQSARYTTFTQNHDVTAKTTAAGLPFTVTAKDIRFDTSLSIGGRGGYWFTAVPWLGLALDAAHFEPGVSGQTVNTAITLGPISTTASIPLTRPVSPLSTSPST